MHEPYRGAAVSVNDEQRVDDAPGGLDGGGVSSASSAREGERKHEGSDGRFSGSLSILQKKEEKGTHTIQQNHNPHSTTPSNSANSSMSSSASGPRHRTTTTTAQSNEITPITSIPNHTSKDYNSISAPGVRSRDTSQTQTQAVSSSSDEERNGPNGTVMRNNSTSGGVGPGGAGRERERDREREGLREGWSKWWEKWGSVELENKGSVARDHLALERTFLAWLRTSLSFASIGIAITQLFRLNASLQSHSTPSPHDTPNNNPPAPFSSPQYNPTSHNHRLAHLGKPLGATFIGISLFMLLIGFHRYFEAQHYVIRGKFPASRGSVVVVAGVAGSLIVACFVVVVWVGGGRWEE